MNGISMVLRNNIKDCDHNCPFLMCKCISIFSFFISFVFVNVIFIKNSDEGKIIIINLNRAKNNLYVKDCINKMKWILKGHFLSDDLCNFNIFTSTTINSMTKETAKEEFGSKTSSSCVWFSWMQIWSVKYLWSTILCFNNVRARICNAQKYKDVNTNNATKINKHQGANYDLWQS